MDKQTINKFWLPALIFAVVAVLLYAFFFIDFWGSGKEADLNTLTDQQIIEFLKQMRMLQITFQEIQILAFRAKKF
jgi:hypothetical protein